jgi:ribulose-5-phosphate 4-epimerase/fuculose-1-phosphate aldolase
MSDPGRTIAAACRALAVADIFDMHGHISVRDGDVLRINDHTASRIAVRPDQIATVRIADGSTLQGNPPSETPLHVAVYRARSDAGSVVHAHPRYSTTFPVAGRPLVTAFNAGAVFGKQVPVYDDPDLIRTEAQGVRLAAALGAERAVLMRGHGFTAVAEDVPSAVMAALYLEESAQRLWLALAIGEPRAYTDDEVQRLAAAGWSRNIVRKTWTDALARARLAGALADLEPPEIPT